MTVKLHKLCDPHGTGYGDFKLLHESTVREMRKRGGAWAAYQCVALDSSRIGQITCIKYGPGTSTPELQETAIHWSCLLVGYIKFDHTEAWPRACIVEEVQPPVEPMPDLWVPDAEPKPGAFWLVCNVRTKDGVYRSGVVKIVEVNPHLGKTGTITWIDVLGVKRQVLGKNFAMGTSRHIQPSADASDFSEKEPA